MRYVKIIKKEELFAAGWIPKDCHRNMSRGNELVESVVGKPIYWCKLAVSKVSKKAARQSLESSYEAGSAVLERIWLIADPKSIDGSRFLTPVVYKAYGHSFYVSIQPTAEPDAYGLYALGDLLVHDPALLPLENLKEGMPYYKYLQSVVSSFEKYNFAMDFTSSDAMLEKGAPPPIPSYNFAFTAPEKKHIADPTVPPQAPKMKSAAQSAQAAVQNDEGAFAGFKSGFLLSKKDAVVRKSEVGKDEATGAVDRNLADLKDFFKRCGSFVQSCNHFSYTIYKGIRGLPLVEVPFALNPEMSLSIPKIISTAASVHVSFVQACGSVSFLHAYKFAYLICKLKQAGKIPSKIIAIGSGPGFWERLFETLGFSVEAFDKEKAKDSFLRVKSADLPKDLDCVLPERCEDSILFSAYPQGYLGEALDRYVTRGGKTFFTCVEGYGVWENMSYLMTDMHAGFEPDTGAAINKALTNMITKHEDDGSWQCYTFNTSDPLEGKAGFYSVMECYGLPSIEMTITEMPDPLNGREYQYVKHTPSLLQESIGSALSNLQQ